MRDVGNRLLRINSQRKESYANAWNYGGSDDTHLGSAVTVWESTAHVEKKGTYVPLFIFCSFGILASPATKGRRRDEQNRTHRKNSREGRAG